MKSLIRNFLIASLVVVSIISLSSCATYDGDEYSHEPSDMVNVYVATPEDGTVANMLDRWAKQDGRVSHFITQTTYPIDDVDAFNAGVELHPGLTAEQSFNRVMDFMNTNRLGLHPLLLHCYYKRGRQEFFVTDNLGFACSPND
jgi:hypothetical protein